METLHLNLKTEWFDMILERIKKEEYRDLSDYWKRRFEKAKREGVKTITFSNGYRKGRRQMIIELNYIRIGGGVKEWGAVSGKNYFVSVLGDIISSTTGT